MKVIKSNLIGLTAIVFAFTSLQACHTKKLVQKSAPVAEVPKPVAAPVVAKSRPVDRPVTTPLPVAKPNYNFSNIQFEFDSGILRTASYPVLDKAIIEMKKDPSVKFMLKGYASIEGTPQHNMELSEDRANAVKTYLVNSGVTTMDVLAKGFGTSDPIGNNNTESGKELNRRVEIQLQK